MTRVSNAALNFLAILSNECLNIDVDVITNYYYYVGLVGIFLESFFIAVQRLGQ